MVLFNPSTTFSDGHMRDMPFTEKKDYIPQVRIEYVDNLGRALPPKEVPIY